MAKSKGLGRGLDALLGGNLETLTAGDVLRTLKVEQLTPGRYQPRTQMDGESLAQLAASIRAQGIMQPILVREVAAERYEIIAGERRWRAAQLAGLDEVPALVREIADETSLVMSLIENIQRENLNPLEEAAGIKRLIDEFGMTHQQAAEAVGRSRTAVTNLLRLLSLAAPVQEMLMKNRIDMGHARALLALEGATQVTTAEAVAQRGLSVRETERLVQRTQQPVRMPLRKTDPDILRLQERIADRLGTKVAIRHGKSGGKLVIDYKDLKQLDSLLTLLGLRLDEV